MHKKQDDKQASNTKQAHEGHTGGENCCSHSHDIANHENKDIEHHNKQSNAEINLADKIHKLEKQLEDSKQIASKAQYDYINLKMDFDGYTKRNEESKKDQKVETLIEVVKKFIPFVENLRKSLMSITNTEDPMVKGLQMIYDNFLKTLEDMSIFGIESIGLTPDTVLHEPVSTQVTEDKNLKGKIVMEFERGFVYRKDGIQKIINTSKVVIGS